VKSRDASKKEEQEEIEERRHVRPREYSGLSWIISGLPVSSAMFSSERPGILLFFVLFYSRSSGASLLIFSVRVRRSWAGASSRIQGLHSVLMVIVSSIIGSRQKYSGGTGEYTRSFPHVGQ
jgi:hypothetical protein